MNLNERAQEAVRSVFAQQGMEPDAVLLSIAAMCWLDGYGAGLATARHLAVSAISAAEPS